MQKLKINRKAHRNYGRSCDVPPQMCYNVTHISSKFIITHPQRISSKKCAWVYFLCPKSRAFEILNVERCYI